MRILIVAAIAAAMCSGCATVTRGTSQAWTVQTEPAGADVRLSSGETCKSPCTLKKKRKHGFTVDIAKDGYEPVKTDVVSTGSKAGAWGMAGNALVGGLIGVGIDAGSGATRDLSPNPLVVKLTPATAPVAADAVDGATSEAPAADAAAAPAVATASAANDGTADAAPASAAPEAMPTDTPAAAADGGEAAAPAGAANAGEGSGS